MKATEEGSSSPAVPAGFRSRGSCPLCAGSSGRLDEFAFAPKPPLPTIIRFEFCERCNFIFAVDIDPAAYASHYASVPNDGDHVVASDDPDSDHRLQAGHIADALPPDFDGDVLDFGCGQGRLLHALSTQFPKASLYGHDVIDYLRKPHDITFVADLKDLARRFDLIVVSHVVEHLVDFGLLSRLTDLLRAEGLLYIEVPDPFAYSECRRREFMYYFDRLHINHFSGTAVRRMLAGLGLHERRSGSHRFRYRDGHYPAAFSISSRGRADARHRSTQREAPLDEVYRAYREDERSHAVESRRRLREAVGPERPLVYGGGDNFRRARWQGGPLDGMDLLAVIDRRADEMPAEDGYRFEPPEALQRYPTEPVIVTVSEKSESIATMLRATNPDRVVCFV